MYVPAKKPTKKKNIETNISKVVINLHDVWMKGIAVRGNVNGKFGVVYSPTKSKKPNRSP